MDERQTIPGLNQNQSEAAAALKALLLGTLLSLSTFVLGLELLSGLPEDMFYGILFAIAVFGIICGFAFVKTDVPATRVGPPQIRFRNPPRRRARRPPTPQRMQALR